MRVEHRTLQLETPGRGTIEITSLLAEAVRDCAVGTGTCTVFIHHTSASLIVCENADPDVRTDLETWLARAVPDGDPAFIHTLEGPDDMPAHVRSTLTATSLSLPIQGGRLDLGTWQGVFVYEHRRSRHSRRLSLTLIGE